jgi:hypothetical protein
VIIVEGSKTGEQIACCVVCVGGGQPQHPASMHAFVFPHAIPTQQKVTTQPTHLNPNTPRNIRMPGVPYLFKIAQKLGGGGWGGKTAHFIMSHRQEGRIRSRHAQTLTDVKQSILPIAISKVTETQRRIYFKQIFGYKLKTIS